MPHISSLYLKYALQFETAVAVHESLLADSKYKDLEDKVRSSSFDVLAL
jgi:hypothetical protein